MAVPSARSARALSELCREMGLLMNASVAMAAAGLTVPRCASERGLAKGGGRPAERRFTVGGSGKSVARCHRTVLAYWKFESISLQRRVMRTLSSSQTNGKEKRVEHRIVGVVPLIGYHRTHRR